MNVTENQLKSYIELFHRTLAETANEFIPPEHRQSLFHLSLLPAKIVGYVSTQFGAGIEYVKAPVTEVVTVRGGRRIEELFTQAPPQIVRLKPMIQVSEGALSWIRHWGIASLTLKGSFPFWLEGPNSLFTINDVAFEVDSWKREVFYAEICGNRSAEFWQPERAVARAKDEILNALSQLKRAEHHKLDLSEYLKKFRERTVLVLGDYSSDGLDRLKKITGILQDLGYDPILVQDFPDSPSQDLSQKVVTFGGLCRFVIVDDSSKSGHLTEARICKENDWVTVLLRDGGKGASWMTAGFSKTSKVINEQAYDATNPSAGVAQAVAWAEEKIHELKLEFDAMYPWRW